MASLIYYHKVINIAGNDIWFGQIVITPGNFQIWTPETTPPAVWDMSTLGRVKVEIVTGEEFADYHFGSALYKVTCFNITKKILYF